MIMIITMIYPPMVTKQCLSSSNALFLHIVTRAWSDDFLCGTLQHDITIFFYRNIMQPKIMYNLIFIIVIFILYLKTKLPRFQVTTLFSTFLVW